MPRIYVEKCITISTDELRDILNAHFSMDESEIELIDCDTNDHIERIKNVRITTGQFESE